MTPGGEVLGLANQVLHGSTELAEVHRREVSKRETRQQKRDHPGRESRLWLAGCEATGTAPQGCTWIDIADRGSDTFEFLAYEHARGGKYVIRSARDRRLDGEDHAARHKDAELISARTLVPLLWVRVLSAKLHGRPRDDPSIREFLVGVARLGGHLGRKGDGPPGWLTLWRGWNDLHLMIQGALVMRGVT